MDAEAEIRGEPAARFGGQRDIAERRHEQHDTAGVRRDLARVLPALADRDRADLSTLCRERHARIRRRLDFARGRLRAGQCDAHSARRR